MNNRATVIILPPSTHDGAERFMSSAEGLPALSAFHTTLHRVLASQLPMVLVAPRPVTDLARGLLPHACLVEVNTEDTPPGHQLAHAVAQGVLASSQADGWLILPGDMPMLQVDTLTQVSNALQSYPIAYPQYRARQGHPMGFGRELFSELVHLDHDRDLYRLMSRYPSEGIDVDDPGVTIHRQTEPATLMHERAERRADNPISRT